MLAVIEPKSQPTAPKLVRNLQKLLDFLIGDFTINYLLRLNLIFQ